MTLAIGVWVVGNVCLSILFCFSFSFFVFIQQEVKKYDDICEKALSVAREQEHAVDKWLDSPWKGIYVYIVSLHCFQKRLQALLGPFL